MNKLKGVLLLVFVYVVVFPCFGNGVVIKRKKNKWISSYEQQTSIEPVVGCNQNLHF